VKMASQAFVMLSVVPDIRAGRDHKKDPRDVNLRKKVTVLRAKSTGGGGEV